MKQRRTKLSRKVLSVTKQNTTLITYLL